MFQNRSIFIFYLEVQLLLNFIMKNSYNCLGNNLAVTHSEGSITYSTKFTKHFIFPFFKIHYSSKGDDITVNRSSRPDVFCKKSVLRKRVLLHRCFPVNFGKFLRTLFYRTRPDDYFCTVKPKRWMLHIIIMLQQ